MTAFASVSAVQLDSTRPSASKGSPFVAGTAARAHPIPSKGFLRSAPSTLGLAIGAALCRHCRSRTSLKVARRDLLGAGIAWVGGAERALARSTTAPEIVKRLWAGGLSSGEDLDAWVAAFAADCVYEDLYYAQPATGRQELRRRLLQEKLLPKGARMILDHVSDGRSSCGFTWHIQQEGVAYVRELGEPLFKAGVLTEQLLQALTKDQPKKLRAASSTTQTPTTAPGIVKYLYGDVQDSGGDAVRFYADDVVYEDMNYDTPFVGKTAVEGFLNRFQDIEGVTFVLEEVSDGEKAVGFTYHIDVAGQSRGIRGVTFYEIDDQGKVKYVRDVPESATKPPPVQQAPKSIFWDCLGC
ncbi:unnamed protein product [Symbiodinium sp. CCMP2456]|nr:unnamed protein product [Symbiodinium sp. CCMP2456]